MKILNSQLNEVGVMLFLKNSLNYKKQSISLVPSLMAVQDQTKTPKDAGNSFVENHDEQNVATLAN